VKPSDGSARFAIIAVTVVIAVGSLIQIFGWGVLALAVIALLSLAIMSTTAVLGPAWG
jgi:hypothetical protein